MFRSANHNCIVIKKIRAIRKLCLCKSISRNSCMWCMMMRMLLHKAFSQVQILLRMKWKSGSLIIFFSNQFALFWSVINQGFEDFYNFHMYFDNSLRFHLGYIVLLVYSQCSDFLSRCLCRNPQAQDICNQNNN